MRTAPAPELDPRFSDPDAVSPRWSEVESALDAAELFWIATVRADRRPHVTPLLAVWSEGAMYFCTGFEEQKARNLEQHPDVAMTTGTNAWREGLDVVVEGRAVRVTDDERLRPLSRLWEEKYGPTWQFGVRDGAFDHDGHLAAVFAVRPTKVLAFRKGSFSQTRYRFGS